LETETAMTKLQQKGQSYRNTAKQNFQPKHWNLHWFHVHILSKM